MKMINGLAINRDKEATSTTVKKIVSISLVLMLLQAFSVTPRANANILSEAYGDFSVGTAMTLGYRACFTPCSAAATLAVVAVNNYVPVVATKTVEYAKPGLFEMFTNWGSTFFRP
jgi:uncharacterized metal-binding protein